MAEQSPLIEAHVLRWAVWAVAGVEAVFWLFTLVLAGSRPAPPNSPNDAGLVVAITTMVFFFLVLPALVLAVLNRALFAAAVLCAVAAIVLGLPVAIVLQG
jgi:hypothetical protein